MNQSIKDTFVFCPRCGTAAESKGSNPFQCAACNFRYFFGPRAAVGGILTDDEGRVLFLKRARDPGRGKLGLPGGFVDVGEGAETALFREVLEETNLKVIRVSYIASFSNAYAYHGIVYPVTDVFFQCFVESFEGLTTEPSEVEECFFRHPTPTELESMAFDSNRRAIERFMEMQKFV